MPWHGRILDSMVRRALNLTSRRNVSAIERLVGWPGLYFGGHGGFNAGVLPRRKPAEKERNDHGYAK
jgi:hypothetical protein